MSDRTSPPRRGGSTSPYAELDWFQRSALYGCQNCRLEMSGPTLSAIVKHPMQPGIVPRRSDIIVRPCAEHSQTLSVTASS